MGRLWWPIVLFILVIVCSISANAWKTIEINQNLAKCIQSMIRNDNATPIKYILISTETDSKSEKLKFLEIVDQLLASNDLDVVFEIDNKNPDKILEFPVHRRILFVDSVKSFRRLIDYQRSHTNDVSGNFQYFYVILPSNVDDLEYIVQQITAFCLANMIADVNILVSNTEGCVTIYSYYPFTPGNCRNSKPVIENYYKNGSFKWIKAVFPLKLMNLWQCPLSVIVWDESPFIINAKKPDRRSGVDIEFLNFFKNNMNVTWNFINIESGPGEIYSNGTISKGFKMLNERRGDLMACGSVLDSKRISRFAATQFYYGKSARIILKPPEKYGPLSVLLFPFDKFTWLIVFLVIVGKWNFEALWNRISKKLYFSKRLSLKALMPVWLLGVLIIRSSYEGSLYKYLHDNPLKKLPQNLNEAITDGYTLIVQKNFYYNYGQKLLMEIDKSSILLIDLPIEEIHKYFTKIKNGKYTLLSSGDYLAGYRSHKSPLREKYQSLIVSDEVILMFYTGIYMPKFSFLTAVLNKQIACIYSSGLAIKVHRDIILNEMKRRKFIAGRNLPVKMSTEHFFGAFQILAGMLVIAGCVFLIEIVSVRNRTTK
ncbi:uncharacterized protein LOC129915002 [Episyrphus balteatus]|uniref:uncharacterized protein LOC129915002 n=1 Tax=Episyrphus balteatus TaxID=286459 RepID=UPI0024869ED4|nr:uncharacterized protein LOC129915002 [Episyrphus balteatus]